MNRIVKVSMAFTVVLSMLLSGCGKKAESTDSSATTTPTKGAVTSQGSEKVKVTFLHPFFQDDWDAAIEMRKIYADFAKLHEDEFIFEAVPVESGAEGLYNKCIQEISRGKFPDMVDTAGWNVVPAAVEADLIVDLNPYIEKDPEFKKGIGINYSQNMIDGKIYSVREQLETIGFWYNEDLFEKAGASTPDTWKSWDDFNVAVQKLKICEAIVTPFSLNQGWPSDILFNAHLIGTQAGRAFAGTSITNFNDQAFKNTLTFMGEDVLKQIKSDYFDAANSEKYRTDFLDGKAAMLFNGVWEASSFFDDVAVNAEDIKPAIFPTEEDGKTASLVSASPGYMISKNQDQAKIDICVEFVKYMTSKEVADRIFEKVLAMPSYEGFDYDKYINDANTLPSLKMLAQACKLAASADYKTKAMGANWGQDIASAIDGKYSSLHLGSKDAEAIVAELNSAFGMK